MHSRDFFVQRKGFTLIELLVVIAIIAILAVVVVLTLNPAQLLAQSRDANRVSDMATLNSAIGLYQTDTGGVGNLGTSSVVYTSLIDNTTSSCGGLGLSALPTAYVYNCASSTSSRLTNSQGWIPIDFTKISSGSPFGSLPVDPVNSSSTGLSYTFITAGTRYMVNAIPESFKQKNILSTNPSVPNYPDVIANGSSLAINPLFNATGLVGYWTMDEGSGSSTQDLSGSGSTGSWAGTAAGTNNTYYTSGKVGPWAGYFNGSNTNMGANISLTTGFYTISAWINPSDATQIARFFSSNSFAFLIQGNITTIGYGGATAIYRPPANVWTLLTATYNGNTSSIYANGNLLISASTTALGASSGYVIIGAGNSGGYQELLGSLDDVRIYNRALSAAEIQAIYNAEK